MNGVRHGASGHRYIRQISDLALGESGVGHHCGEKGSRLPPCIATATDMAGVLTLGVMGLEVSVEMLFAIEHLVTSGNSASHALSLYPWLGDC